MWFMSAICFSWSWILRNVDFGEKLLWFVRCVWWKDNRGMGACRGIFPSAQPQCSKPVYLQRGPPSVFFPPSQFYTHFLSHVFEMCVYVYFRVCSWACMHSALLLAATMYVAKYLHVSQAFGPSLVPTVRPLTHGSQPILSSYRMRQCRTWGG